MNQSELARMCRTRGFSIQEKRGEVMLKRCTFCGNSNYNLELSAEKGVFHAWCCRSSGRLQDFIEKFLGEERHVPVQVDSGKKAARKHRPDIADQAGLVPAWEIASARSYLHSRDLTDQDIGLYNICVSTREDHEFYGRLVFPLREYWTSEEFGYLARSYTNKEPRYLTQISQREVALFQTIREEYIDIHLLVEGIFDAIRGAQAGFRSGAFLGKPSTSLLQEWGALVEQGDPVVVMMDGDAKESAKRAASALRTVHDTVIVHDLPRHLDPAALDIQVLEARVLQELEGT